MVLAELAYPITRPAPRGLIADARARYGRPRLPETILHAAWRRAGRVGLVLKSGEGRAYRVIYPGRPAGGQGPDFVDAIIETEDGVRLCGDIEIHVRSSDWRAHGHSSDSRYNGVLFHVALADSGVDAVTRSGRPIPLLVMKQAAARGTTEKPADNPAITVPSAMPVPFLDLGTAGDERFANRSDGYAHEIQVLGADQAIYEGLMDCMGFPRNRAGFRRLARRLPWSKLRGATEGSAEAGDEFESLLMWAAGFGERPPNAPTLSGRAPEWAPQSGRPDNRPERRVSGVASLVARTLADGGPATYCTRAVRDLNCRDLAQAFSVPAERGRALIGTARAGEIVVNAVLPFMHALATACGDRRLAGRALAHYRSHPALPTNSLVREAELVLSSAMEIPRKPGAREQQGLIHVYRMMTSKIVRPRQLPMV